MLSVYFVDDNFIGNQKAVLELLPHLVEWQTRRRYPLRFACEATLNLAKNERVLALMRAAGFVTVFCGIIETPEPAGPRGARALTRCGWAPPAHAGSVAAGRGRIPSHPAARPPAADRTGVSPAVRFSPLSGSARVGVGYTARG